MGEAKRKRQQLEQRHWDKGDWPTSGLSRRILAYCVVFVGVIVAIIGLSNANKAEASVIAQMTAEDGSNVQLSNEQCADGSMKFTAVIDGQIMTGCYKVVPIPVVALTFSDGNTVNVQAASFKAVSE